MSLKEIITNTLTQSINDIELEQEQKDRILKNLFDKFEPVYSKIEDDILKNNDPKPIKVFSKVKKIPKLSEKEPETLITINEAKKDDDFKKITLPALKDFSIVNGLPFKTSFKKEQLISNVIKFNSINTKKTSQYFTIDDEYVLLSKLKKNETLFYKGRNFKENIIKLFDKLKRFEDDIILNIYYSSTNDSFISIMSDAAKENKFFCYFLIDGQFNIEVNKNFIIEEKQITGQKTYHKVF
jgi:hypothetical protein